MTLFFAIALHAIIILGITFGHFDDPPPENILPTLDITVSSRSTAEKVKPTQAIPEQAPAVMPQQPVQAPTQVVTSRVAKEKVHQQETETPEAEKPEISATELIERSMEMVNLNEQLNESMQAYAHRPRHIYVSARTQEYKYANYMSEWVKKVERVGNLNYPDEARRSGLTGKLIMDVTMNADGTVVNLAAPFPPFPADIRKDADIMHITRTWEFSTSNTLKSH